MRAIGIDIGTTTICGVVVDGNTGAMLDTITENNKSVLQRKCDWEKLQEPDEIFRQVSSIVKALSGKYESIKCIGVTGQMHGIVYINGEGNAASPLFTWQDGRGDLAYKDGLSYAEFLGAKTDHKLATGYGSVTHFYNVCKGQAPDSAQFICTIADYVAMKLAQCKAPRLNPSNAASLGLFSLETNSFDTDAIRSAGMDEAVFPVVSRDEKLLGVTGSNIVVAAAIGDNQASFLGSVRDMDRSVLLNVGTGSQVSIYTEGLIHSSGIETRPFADKGFLQVGAPLCGGNAYALLEGFFRSVVHMATGKEPGNLYSAMDRYAEDVLMNENRLQISTCFKGTRDNPSLRGEISNIGINNFTPQHFAFGVLEGIAQELHGLFENMTPPREKAFDTIVGSGNGIRKSALLQKILTRMFNMKLQIPVYREEAAYGAALFAMTGAGHFKDTSEAQALISYKEEEL